MFKTWSLLTRLFAIYALIVFLIIPLSYLGFYQYYRSVAEQRLSQLFQWEASSIAEHLNNAIAAADGLAVNTLAHPSIEAWMKETTDANTNSKVINTFNKMRLDLDIEPDSFNRISIIKDNGTFLTYGSAYNREQVRQSIGGLAWFSELESKSVLVTPPHRDDWDAKGKMVVSVIRSSVPGTVIEVQIPYSYLEAMLNRSKPASTGMHIILYGSNDDILYADAQPMPYSDQQVTAEITLLHSDWRLVVTQPLDSLLNSVRKTGYWMAFIAGSVSLISLALFYWFTSRTTRPLVQLSLAMEQVPGDASTSRQLERQFRGIDAKGSQNETVRLYRAFTSMLQRMDESKQQAIEAHSRELQAQFIALQAQMNPHFLYNTLTLIGMLGMEEGNEEIPKITSELVHMLRYITYAGQELVALQEEVDHSLRYIDIMKMRYREHLEVEVNLRGDLTSVYVPKLIVQPFVENAMKHAFAGKKYPWRIALSVAVSDRGWEIRVEDDGEGFPADVLDKFYTMQREPVRFGMSPSEEGLGMWNTYSRLLHKFGSGLRFELSNRQAGGAAVYISYKTGVQADAENLAG